MPKYLVDLVASAANYEAHLRPIWEALPEEARGEIRTGSAAENPPMRNHVCMVASWRDLSPLRGLTKFIYVEHGAGQSYAGDEKSALWPDYSASHGARHMDVLGYICPSQRVADLWHYAPAAAVGCPRLDAYLTAPAPTLDRSVCFNFHWPCKVAPEAGTAYYHYWKTLPVIFEEFESQGWHVYSHIHPKWEGELTAFLGHAGAVPLRDPLVAQVLVSDNSSTQYEAAALGIHNIVLNCPQYRRDVNHGLRFWEAVPGVQIDEPDQLLAVQLDKVIDSPLSAHLRDRAASYAYAHLDGQASHRAAGAILTWID